MTRTLETDALDAISCEVERCKTLLGMTRAKLNEDDRMPACWPYFDDAMVAHLDRIDALLSGRADPK